jgi:hypothetical protein
MLRASAFGIAEAFQAESTAPQLRMTELARCLVGTEIVLMSWIEILLAERTTSAEITPWQLCAARQGRPPADGPGVPS